MPPENDDDLKSFQIGLRSGVAAAPKKVISTETFEVSKEEYPNLSAANRTKATFRKKAGEKVQVLKDIAAKEPSAEEKERAEKAKKAWERAMEVISQLSVKD